MKEDIAIVKDVGELNVMERGQCERCGNEIIIVEHLFDKYGINSPEDMISQMISHMETLMKISKAGFGLTEDSLNSHCYLKCSHAYDEREDGEIEEIAFSDIKNGIGCPFIGSYIDARCPLIEIDIFNEATDYETCPAMRAKLLGKCIIRLKKLLKSMRKLKKVRNIEIYAKMRDSILKKEHEGEIWYE